MFSEVISDTLRSGGVTLLVAMCSCFNWHLSLGRKWSAEQCSC